MEEQTAGVYYTEDSGNLAFVGNAECHQGSHLPLEQLAAGLVSSPSYGVVDSGCGRTLIGRSTLRHLVDKLKPLTTSKVEEYPSVNTFRFGNGAMEVSERACRIPVAIGRNMAVSMQRSYMDKHRCSSDVPL